MIDSIKNVWKCCEHWAQEHHEAAHHVSHGAHLCYFALIVFHGPYQIAAGGLLVIGAVTWVLRLEH